MMILSAIPLYPTPTQLHTQGSDPAEAALGLLLIVLFFILLSWMDDGPQCVVCNAYLMNHEIVNGKVVCDDCQEHAQQLLGMTE